MTGPLYAIGRFCSRHHWPVIGVWLVLAIALVLIGQAGGSKTSENLTLPGSGTGIAALAYSRDGKRLAVGTGRDVGFDSRHGVVERKVGDIVQLFLYYAVDGQMQIAENGSNINKGGPKLRRIGRIAKQCEQSRRRHRIADQRVRERL